MPAHNKNNRVADLAAVEAVNAVDRPLRWRTCGDDGGERAMTEHVSDFELPAFPGSDSVQESGA